MGDLTGYWVYVVDEDRGRFAIVPRPVADPAKWQEQVRLAGRDGARRLHAGALALDQAQSFSEAARLIRGEVGDLEQFEPRAILSAATLSGLR